LHGYDWENTHINLENQVFEKIFKVFNLYNFTVREDEPLEKEVAVDPEMLGKVFENLLEIKDRKSKGAYYTPREIVHYMCQESLINYLDTALNAETKKVDKEDIEGFIREGDLSIERDQAREEGKLKDDEYGLPESIREHAREIDYALADVKICDPAIGSGAFPVGMMTEIVRARSVLTPYLTNQRNRDPYAFKWHCIENSLYGVDIDPGAVEIAKLRLWLSLVVDEENYDRIRPLPNLDYRIVCGNSLLSVEKNLFNYTLYPELEKKKLQYFGTTSPKNKKALQREIENLINQLTDGKKLFDFTVYFSEVFSSKQGFNIVIANPPYVDSENMLKEENNLRELYNSIYVSAKGNWDLFVIFIERGDQIINDNGVLTYIVPNKLIGAKYSEGIRKFMLERGIQFIRDYSSVNVFKEASVYPIVFLFTNDIEVIDFVRMTKMSTVEDIFQDNRIPKSTFYEDIYWDRYFVDAESLQLILKISRFPKLVSYNDQILGAATVGEAYDLKEIMVELEEASIQKYKKFINTGTIDPFVSYWGYKNTRYIKTPYSKPVVGDIELEKMMPRRYQQATSPKLIIGGM